MGLKFLKYNNKGVKYIAYNVEMTNNQWQKVLLIVVQIDYQILKMKKHITNLITKCKVWTSKLVKQIQFQKQNQNNIIEKTTSRIQKFKFFTSKYKGKIPFSTQKTWPKYFETMVEI